MAAISLERSSEETNLSTRGVLRAPSRPFSSSSHASWRQASADQGVSSVDLGGVAGRELALDELAHDRVGAEQRIRACR